MEVKKISSLIWDIIQNRLTDFSTHPHPACTTGHGVMLSVLCELSHSIMPYALQPHGLDSPPGSSVHGIFQARILKWVAIFFSRGFCRPRDQTLVSGVSCIAEGFFTTESPGKTPYLYILGRSRSSL